MTKIAVLVGSLREGSSNQHFAEAVEKLLPEGVEFAYANLNLPLYNQDLEASYPADATKLKELIESSDGVFIVTPEYNRGYPGVLKNAIDWASRPWGTNSFDGKPAVIAGVSGSPLGTTQAQSQLRNVLIYLNTKLMGQPEAYLQSSRALNEDGTLTDEVKEFAQTFTNALVAHVQSTN